MSENTRSNIAVIGAGGRMGESLCRLINNDKALSLSFGFGRGDGHVSNWNAANKETEVVIDFSSPDLFLEALDFCVKNQIAFVSGTTGLNDSAFGKLNEAAKEIPVLWASNMSIGVQFVNRLLSEFSQLSSDFNFQISEWHHVHKKDSPSGTAITLQKTLQDVVADKLPAIKAFREGEVFGIHEVEAKSNEEIITIKHEALNRDVFSKGAIVAAKSLIGKLPGRYYL